MGCGACMDMSKWLDVRLDDLAIYRWSCSCAKCCNSLPALLLMTHTQAHQPASQPARTLPLRPPSFCFPPSSCLSAPLPSCRRASTSQQAMSSPQAQINKAFGTKKTLYEILGVAKDATAAAIRKAYFKMALTCVSGGGKSGGKGGG